MLPRKYFPALPFCLMVMGQGLFSQIVLEGIVTDSGSEPVLNALVELIDQADTSRKFSDYTNEQGEYRIEITDTGIDDSDSQNPGSFRLLQNYPNPFNPSTVIPYELSRPAHICIEIHNILGQKVKTLFEGFQSRLAGELIWDGTDDQHQGVPSGVYIYSLSAEGRSLHKKMLLIDGGQSVSNGTLKYGMETELPGQYALTKISSDVYSLRVTGADIETYEQQDLGITSNTVLDITVYRTVTDIDGNVYRTVKIGDQWWMMENLKVTHYRNGDNIPNVTDYTEWKNLITGAYSNYNNAVDSTATWGSLYNWYTVNDPRGLAPAGWHVPTDEEWTILTDYLGGTSVAGGKLKETGTTRWTSPNTGATNESGFSALPGGYRFNFGDFYNLGYNAYFWSSTDREVLELVWYRGLFHDSPQILQNDVNKTYGFSVRCVRGSEPSETVTDIDGNVYPTVKIGNQLWMAENLKVTHYRNGEVIPNVTDNTEWSNLTTEACCSYNNDDNNVATYGRLYNWYAVNDSRGLAPAGWHVPSDEEWQILADYLGGSAAAGGKLKEGGTTHWSITNIDVTNESDFTALPGGGRYSGDFHDMTISAYFWSSTENNNLVAWYRGLDCNFLEIGRYYEYKQNGFSVRCVKD